jgi:hypothetical protein
MTLTGCSIMPQSVKVVKTEKPHIQSEAVPQYRGKTWRDLAEYAKKLHSQDTECQAKIEELNK